MKLKERERIHRKRERYADAVRKDFVPITSEVKRAELVNEILQPKNPMSRGGSHVSTEHIITCGNNPNHAPAVKKGRYLSNQRLTCLPEINEARAEEDQKQKVPMQDEEIL